MVAPDLRVQPRRLLVAGIIVSAVAAVLAIVVGIVAWLAAGGDAGESLPAEALWDLAWWALVIVAVAAPIVGAIAAAVVRRRLGRTPGPDRVQGP